MGPRNRENALMRHGRRKHPRGLSTPPQSQSSFVFGRDDRVWGVLSCDILRLFWKQVAQDSKTQMCRAYGALLLPIPDPGLCPGLTSGRALTALEGSCCQTP